MSNIESVLRKIRALRALSKSSNIHEAEAAAAQAAALIQKHRLDEAELETGGEVDHEAIGNDGGPLDVALRSCGWKQLLASKLANHYGCYVFNVRTMLGKRQVGARVDIVGRPSDVAIVRYMYAWLGVEIDRLSDVEYGRGAKNAFRLGAVTGIGNTLVKSKIAAEREHARTNGGSAAMVLTNRAALSRQWAETTEGKMGATRPIGTMGDQFALLRGVQAGEAIHLGAALPDGGRTRALQEHKS